MTSTSSTAEIERRVRDALSTVAETVTETVTEHSIATAPPRPPHRSKRRWRIGLGLGAVAVPVIFAASAIVRQGPEYVDTIPREDIVVEGSVDGSSYLLIETTRTDTCGQAVTGVELVEERENLLGSEWNTTGTAYGEPNGCGSYNATARYLADPSLYNDGGAMVGDTMVWTWAVHPSVTAVRITADHYAKDLPVHRVDGAGYALFEVPKELREYTAELLVDGAVVPGSEEAHTVRER